MADRAHRVQTCPSKTIRETVAEVVVSNERGDGAAQHGHRRVEVDVVGVEVDTKESVAIRLHHGRALFALRGLGGGTFSRFGYQPDTTLTSLYQGCIRPVSACSRSTPTHGLYQADTASYMNDTVG